MSPDAGMNNNTEKLVNSMLSFLDDSDDVVDDFEDEKKNPICWGIKRINNIFPKSKKTKHAVATTDSSWNFYENENRRHCNDIENDCRFKDPYLAEVNRSMCFPTAVYPVNGSLEYDKEVENYAISGKDFLDFPTDIKFHPSIDFSSTEMPCLSLSKLQPPPGFGISTTVGMYYSNQLFQTLVQPPIYSNPQHLNTFVNNSQINVIPVQHQQILSGGGIQDRQPYAQLLQQHILSAGGIQDQQAYAQLLQQQILSTGGGIPERLIYFQMLQQQIRAYQSKL